MNFILDSYQVEKACIIRTWKTGRADEWIDRENEQYEKAGIRLESISLKSFFCTYFSAEEYDVFVECVEQYLEETREISGCTSIKYLSSMNLAVQKIYEEKILSDWDYKNYQYKIIDSKNKRIQNYLYLANTVIPENELKNIDANYIQRKLFKSMLGCNEYAESFITSEWLYHSLKGKKNFDYTSVISGYLKSIEQLLYQIVLINVDNNCRISMSGAEKVRNKAISAGVKAYIYKKNRWRKVSIGLSGYYYIDLTRDQIKYMNSSIGSFEYFLRYNPQIFYNHQLATMISDMVSCFRTECRNSYFHTYNLKKWDIVEKTRSNALYLYYILLGECIIPKEKEYELGIKSTDDFDELCRKIVFYGAYVNWQGIQNAQKQELFLTTRIDNDTYIVVMTDGDEAILEKDRTGKDGKLKICKDKYMKVDCKNLLLEKRNIEGPVGTGNSGFLSVPSGILDAQNIP